MGDVYESGVTLLKGYEAKRDKIKKDIEALNESLKSIPSDRKSLVASIQEDLANLRFELKSTLYLVAEAEGSLKKVQNPDGTRKRVPSKESPAAKNAKPKAAPKAAPKAKLTSTTKKVASKAKSTGTAGKRGASELSIDADLSSWTVVQMREELEKRELDTAGLKADLMLRLQEANTIPKKRRSKRIEAPTDNGEKEQENEEEQMATAAKAAAAAAKAAAAAAAAKAAAAAAKAAAALASLPTAQLTRKPLPSAMQTEGQPQAADGNALEADQKQGVAVSNMVYDPNSKQYGCAQCGQVCKTRTGAKKHSGSKGCIKKSEEPVHRNNIAGWITKLAAEAEDQATQNNGLSMPPYTSATGFGDDEENMTRHFSAFGVPVDWIAARMAVQDKEISRLSAEVAELKNQSGQSEPGDNSTDELMAAVRAEVAKTKFNIMINTFYDESS